MKICENITEILKGAIAHGSSVLGIQANKLLRTQSHLATGNITCFDTEMAVQRSWEISALEDD